MNKSLMIMLFAVSAVLAQTPGPNGAGGGLLHGAGGTGTTPPNGAPGPGPQGGTTKPKVVVNSEAWSQMVAAAAQDPTQIKTLMSGLSAEQFADFASAVINAIETLPSDPDLVIADRVASAAKELIGGTPGQQRTEVISVVFSVTQVAYLPAVAENLAGSFSKSANNMTDANYQDIAKVIIGAVAEKTATADNGTARLAITVSVFESGGGLTPEQTQTLVGQACPNVQQTTRETVTTVANQISTAGSYAGVANLTGVTLSITPTTQQQITQREQTTAQQPAQQQTQTQQQTSQQQTTEQQTQTQQQTTTEQQPQPQQQGQQTTTPTESNNIGAPALNPPVNSPAATTEGLLGAINNRGTDSIGNVVTGGTGGTTGNADQSGGDQGGGTSTGGGDITPPPPPPPPPPPLPPTPYQGQS